VFLGFTNFYKHFIYNYLDITQYLSNYISSRFNLPSDLVPLIGLYRLIPIVKTQYLLRKTHFLGEQKTPKGNVRGNTSR